MFGLTLTDARVRIKDWFENENGLIVKFVESDKIEGKLYFNNDDEDMISENDRPKILDMILTMIDESGLVNTIKSSGGYDTFVTIIPDYFKSKTKKIDLINDIIVYDEEAGGRIYLEDFMNPIVILEEIVDGATFQHEISFIENDIVCVAVWEYDEDGDQLDDMNDTYDMYLEEIQPRHLNQIFEGLINEYLRWR